MSQAIDGPDMLMAHVTMSQFKDNDGLHLRPLILTAREIPPQIKLQSDADNIDTSGSAAKWIASSSGLLQFLIKALIGISLQTFWSMLNEQQLIVHFPLSNGLFYPTNAAIFNRHLVDFVQFELLPTELILSVLYGDQSDSDKEAINMNFEENGFESKLIILNVPTMIFQFFLFVILALFVMVNALCKNRCMGKLRSD